MATLLESLNEALRSATGPGPPDLPEVLVGLDAKVAELGQISVEWGANGLEEWLSKFHQLFDDDAIRDSLCVRFLQLRLPRIAEALTIAGIVTIEYTPTGVRASPVPSAATAGRSVRRVRAL
jgi:hypothetical protein